MSKVTLNNHEYDGVQTEFLDGISSRLSTRLHKSRTVDRMTVDQLSVTSELDRLYGGGIKQKPWYRDFVMQFCRDRKIPCNIKDL